MAEEDFSMEKELKISYKLYAVGVTTESMKEVSTERFCRITPFYILVYTAGDAPKNSVEMTQTETHRLSEQDEQWLRDCNIVIIAEEAKKRESEIAADMAERLSRLEDALKEEKEKQEA